MEKILGSGAHSSCHLKNIVKIAFIFSLMGPTHGSATSDGSSIFDVGGKWQNQYGKSVDLKELGDKPTVISMVYTSCSYSCPLITQKLKSIHSGLEQGIRQNINFVLVSFDPARDTLTTISSYSTKQSLKNYDIEFLISNEVNTHTLSVALDFKYKKLTNGDFSHSNQVFLLNRKGEVVNQYEIGSKTETIIEEIKKKLM